MDPIIYFKNEDDLEKLEKSFRSLIQINNQIGKEIWESGVLHEKLAEKYKNMIENTILNSTMIQFILFLMEISYKVEYNKNNRTSIWILKFLDIYINGKDIDNINSNIFDFYKLKNRRKLKIFLISNLIKYKKYDIFFDYFVLFSEYDILEKNIDINEIIDTFNIIKTEIDYSNIRCESLEEMYKIFSWGNPFFFFSYIGVNTKELFRYFFEFSNYFLPEKNYQQLRLYRIRSEKHNQVKNLFNKSNIKYNNYLLNKIGELKLNVGVLCNKFNTNHSVAKDRILYLHFLQKHFNWNITIYSHNKFSNDMLPELHEALNDMNKIILTDNNLDENYDFLMNEMLDIMIYPEIGMDSKVYFLASVGRYAPIQINFWGHSDTSGLLGLIDEYWMSKYFYHEDMDKNQFIEKIRVFEDLTVIYPTIKINEDILNKPPFILPKSVNDIPIVNVFCGYSFMKMNNLVLRELNQIGEYFDTKENGKPKIIKFICLDNKLQKDEKNRWRIKLKMKYPFFLKNQILFKSLSLDNYRYLLSQSDIFIDSFPFGSCNSVLEAMALGVDVFFIPSYILAGRFALGFKKFLEHNSEISENKKFIFEQISHLGNKGKLIECNSFNEIIKFIDKT